MLTLLMIYACWGTTQPLPPIESPIPRFVVIDGEKRRLFVRRSHGNRGARIFYT